MYYNPKYNDIYVYVSYRATQALVWVRVALPRGLACHVASTWVSRENMSLFYPFLIIFNTKNSKINSEKIQKKISKIRKFITFKI